MLDPERGLLDRGVDAVTGQTEGHVASSSATAVDPAVSACLHPLPPMCCGVWITAIAGDNSTDRGNGKGRVGLVGWTRCDSPNV